VASDYGYGKIEDLHAALGYGKYSPRQILQKLVPDQLPPEPQETTTPTPERLAGPASDKAMKIWSSRSKALTICWSIAPSVATRFAEKASSVMSPAARRRGPFRELHECPELDV